MERILITIRKDQRDWLDKKFINKSKFIQAFIDEQIKQNKEVTKNGI